MKWSKTLQKGGLAILTFLSSYLMTNTELLVGLLPENIAKMTVGSIVAAVIVSVSNWLKNRGK